MLIWHYVVLVFWVGGLVVGWDVDLVVRQLVFAEVFKEICIARAVEVHIGVI